MAAVTRAAALSKSAALWRSAALWLVVAVAGCSAGRSPLTGGNHDLGGHLAFYDGGASSDLSSPRKLDFGNAFAGDLAGPPTMDLAGVVTTGGSVVTDPNAILVHEAKTLYTVDPNTFDLTTIGDFGVTDDITDLAIDPDGHLVAISYTGLYSVDFASGHATLIADKIFTDMNALAYLSDGRLLSADIEGNVYQLTLSGGAPTVTSLGAYGNSRTTAGDLVSVDDGTLWGLTNGGSSSDSDNGLMIVNNVDGHGTDLGATGFGKLWGSAYSNGRIVAFSSTGQVVGIDPSTGAGTLLTTHAGKSFLGAASAPAVLP